MSTKNYNSYITMEAIAAVLALSQSYLKGLAESEIIHSLNVNGRRKFSVKLVQEALNRMQAKGVIHER